MLPAELSGGTVVLRPWDPAEATWYVECVQDPDVQRFTTETPTLTAEEVAAAIRALPLHPERSAYLIADRRSGDPMGNIALTVDGGIGDVSYFVAAAARGRGVAGAALALLAEAAFGHQDVRELRLWTHRDNTASRTVAERAGFRRDPARDRTREVKGDTWPTVAYVRTR